RRRLETEEEPGTFLPQRGRLAVEGQAEEHDLVPRPARDEERPSVVRPCDVLKVSPLLHGYLPYLPAGQRDDADSPLVLHDDDARAIGGEIPEVVDPGRVEVDPRQEALLPLHRIESRKDELVRL